MKIGRKLLIGAALTAVLALEGCGGGGGAGTGVHVNPGHSKAVLGPLSGARIRAYRLTDLATPVETITARASSDLRVAGSFDLALKGIPDDEWILVTATGGEDIDADDDGVVDAHPTPNSGTLASLARAADWRRGANINVLTDLAWRALKQSVDPGAEGVAGRLQWIADALIDGDVDRDGRIDYHDLIGFDPSAAAQRRKLAVPYARFVEKDARGASLIAYLHAGDVQGIERRTREIFGDALKPPAVPKLVPVHPKVVLPANRKGVTASDARVRSFLSSSAEIPAGEGPSVLMAEDAQGHSLLLGYAIPPGSEKRIAQRVGQAAAQQAKQVMDAGNTEISTRSTALALVMLAIGGMNADVDRAALAARVLVHPEFDLLVGQIENAFRADPYFLDSLMNNASLVGRIKAFATRVFEEYVNDERMARLGAGAASGPRTAASQGQSLPADRLAAVGAALPITATGPKTFWYLSPWHSDQPWYWYEVPRKYLVDPPFVAEARGKHLYASGNPTNINYIAEFFSRDGRKLDWRMVPRNSTLIQKLANSGAAQRKWRWGRDIASNVAHVEFNKYITTGDDPQKRAMMDGLFLLHAVTGVVNVFTGTRVFSGLASRLEHNAKLALTLATCGTNLVSTVDFAADSLSGFFKGNGLSLLETTTTACILPIARVVFGPRELTTAFRPLWKKVMANVVAKLSLPAGWASIAVDSANELVPLMVSLATAEPVVGYDLTWRNGDLVAVSRNDARPVPDNRPRVAAPIAKFRFTPKTGRTVFFDASQSSVDTAHGARARYTWDFGDGSRGTGQTVTHAYAAPGRHRVVLKVDDGLGHVATLSHIVDVSNGSAPVITNLTCGPEPSSATSARRISVSAQVTDPDGDLSEVRWYASASDATPETVTGPGFTGNVVLAYPSDGIGVYAPAVEAIDVAGNRSGRKICTYDTRRKGWGLIDDFSTGLGNWVVKSGNWHVQGQTLQVNYDITCGTVTCPHADLLLADKYQGSGDYVASVDFTRTRSGYDFSEAHVDFSLWQSASNRLDIGIGWGAYHWSGGPLNEVRVFVQRWNGTWSRVFYKTVRITWDPDAWNRATIKKKGNTYSLFLNGTYLATFHDTLLNGTGKLGLAAYGTRKLDNFRLEYY